MAPFKNIDYYAVLEVPQTANEEAIKASFRRLALVRHPDKNQGDSSATSEFQLLLEAYEILSDSERRPEYDRLLAAHRNSYSSFTAPPNPPAPEPERNPIADELAKLHEQAEKLQASIHATASRLPRIETDVGFIETEEWCEWVELNARLNPETAAERTARLQRENVRNARLDILKARERIAQSMMAITQLQLDSVMARIAELERVCEGRAGGDARNAGQNGPWM